MDLLKLLDIPLDYRLFVLKGDAITIGSVLFALAAACIGILLSRWISKRISRFLRNHLHLSLGESAAFGRLMYYVLIPLVVILSLSVAHIPLTIFAFLGGAVAIGVGFGSQNIIGNFISGIILLLERTIKVGDVVQVDQYLGRVKNVGFRSTRILTEENIDVIVPNSYFLDRPATNWTFTENGVRIAIAVGVKYGSDCNKVRDLLIQATAGIAGILASPAPSATLNDFGESVLQFKLYFSIDLDPKLSRSDIESAVRFRIQELFTQHGIEMPAPQREIKIITPSPS